MPTTLPSPPAIERAFVATPSDAWRLSATASIGYRETAVNPEQAAAGTRDPWGALHGTK